MHFIAGLKVEFLRKNFQNFVNIRHINSLVTTEPSSKGLGKNDNY